MAQIDLVIRNGTVITGDGKTVLPDTSVFVKGDRIVRIAREEPEPASTVIDASGRYVIPGVINHHAHGVSCGPFSTGAFPFTLEKASRYADRHLLQGTTTLINVCGMGTLEEHARLASRHPMRIEHATGHVPSNIKAIELVDGVGLEDVHRRTAARTQIEQGAAAIGEIGAGGTLGGGAQDYKYIPQVIAAETGVEIHPLQAKALKVAVLGHYMRREDFNGDQVAEVLEETGLEKKLSVERAREIIEEIALPPVRHALQGFDEAAELSAETGVPVVFHSSAVSAGRILELAERHAGSKARLVAGHSNHNMFDVDECVNMARRLRDAGVVIDVSSLDGVITHWRNTSERLEALAREGLIDTISTDFAGGHWDSVLETVHWLVDHEFHSIAQGVALATGNVAKVFEIAAPDRGFIEVGKVADLVLTDDKNVGRVETVVVGGQVVADGGWACYSKNTEE